MVRSSPKHWLFSTVCLGFLLSAIALLLFLPSISYELVALDDPAYIADNALVLNGLSWQSIRAAFTPGIAAAPMYMPLLWISYMVDVSLFHATPVQPWGFHLTNVILHAANAFLLYALLFAIVKKPWSAFFCAALWAIHPLRVESVAWVTERKDVLSGLLALLSVAAYAWGNRGATSRRCNRLGFSLSLGFFTAGLLVKPSIVPLPLLLLGLDIWPLRRLAETSARGRRIIMLFLEKIPYLLLAAGLALMTVHSHRTIGALSATPAWRHLLLVPIHYGFYLLKTVVPTELGPLYPLVQFTWLRWVMSVGVLLTLTGGAWRLRKNAPQVLAGWFWFLTAFLPIIGFFGPVGVHSVADRFTYFPALGLSLLLIPMGTDQDRRARRLLYFVAGGIVLFLSASTSQLLPNWQSNDRVLARVAQTTPDHPALRHVHILHQLQRDGDFGAARVVLEDALRADPRNVELMATLALCIHEEEGTDAALAFLASLPKNSMPRGEQAFQMAMYSFLGGAFEQALLHVDNARNLLAQTDVAQNNLALLGMAAAFENGDMPRALTYARKLPPYRDRVQIVLEDLLPLHGYHWSLGARNEAWAFFKRLLAAHPARGDLFNNIAWLLATAEWSPAPPQEIVELARRALEQAPEPHPVLLDTLAVTYANAGKYAAAVSTVQRALELVPDIPARASFRRDLLSRQKLYQNRIPYREEAAARLWLNR
ncbi:MAG: hypothetical protein GX803_04445 [Lentisphaerae bacterium]|jgi:tetratricopeptide (TPR) repeat protein|nr:hypothetical protein [Lentisphaerota bacterium]